MSNQNNLWWQNDATRKKTSKKISINTAVAWKRGVYEKIPYSKLTKKAWKDGRYKNNSIKIKKAWKDGRYKKINFSKNTKRMWQNGVYDKKNSSNSKKMLKLWSDGVYDDVIVKMRNYKGKLYKGYNMRSGWEVAYAKYLDKNKIKWLYECKLFRLSTGQRYLPDFYLLKTKEWVEIKGRFVCETKRKLEQFKKDFPKEKLIILRYKELKDAGII